MNGPLRSQNDLIFKKNCSDPIVVFLLTKIIIYVELSKEVVVWESRGHPVTSVTDSPFAIVLIVNNTFLRCSMYPLVLLTLKCLTPFYTPFTSIQNSDSFSLPPPILWCCSTDSIFGELWQYSKTLKKKIIRTLSCWRQLWQILAINFFFFFVILLSNTTSLWWIIIFQNIF